MKRPRNSRLESDLFGTAIFNKQSASKPLANFLLIKRGALMIALSPGEPASNFSLALIQLVSAHTVWPANRGWSTSFETLKLRMPPDRLWQYTQSAFLIKTWISLSITHRTAIIIRNQWLLIIVIVQNRVKGVFEIFANIAFLVGKSNFLKSAWFQTDASPISF